MSIIETVLPRKTKKIPEAVPHDIADRIRRGRLAMLKDAPTRRVCQKFWEGDHYWYVNKSTNTLNVLPSSVVDVAGGKPLHRVRNTYNFAASLIEAKVSAATQKVPGYEVTPSTDDPEDEAAASLAGQVATYGYDKWRLRRHTTKAITNALVQREGFVMPYWDQNVAPYSPGSDGKMEGRGELKFLSLSRSEVMWEPGVDFDESPWHAIERAMTPEAVKKIPGFIGGPLTADARTSDIPDGKKSDTMVRLTEFLERPCPDYPEGRRCFIAMNQIVVDYRKVDPLADDWYEPFPNFDADGEVVDEPILHRISYTVNPAGDDLGLMERLIDLSRTIDDCWNKLLEWKNRCLMPQFIAPMGSQFTQANDIPGYVYRYAGSQAPTVAPTPTVPRELVDLLEMAITHMRALAADVDVQPDPRLTTGTANASIEQATNRWQSFLGDTAEFHSRLMRHCLSIVAREYTEDRQIEIRGQYGSEPMESFTGQALRSQVNVRVLPGSIETKSRAAIREEVSWLQTNWPGAISAEAALSVIHGGSEQGLLRSYQNDVARARRVVRRLQNYTPESFGTHFDPNVPDLMTGQMGANVPNWMPREWDSIQIWRQVIGDYMKTEDYERRPEDVQHRFELVWAGLEQTEQMRAAKQAAQQQMQAESLGMGNAAAPQSTPPPLPDRAGFNPDTNQSPVPTP